MRVDRCVCRGVCFEELKRLADETGATCEDVERETGCGESCGLCLPYVRLVLVTGRTSFPLMSADECRRLEERARTPNP